MSVWLLAALGCTSSSPVDYAGWSIARVTLTSPEDRAVLDGAGAEVLTEHALDHADVLVAPVGVGDWSETLRWTTLVPDVGAAQAAQWRRAALTGSWFDDWQDLDAFDQHLDDLAQSPVAEVVELGTSVEGRPIRGLRIAAGAPDGRRGTLITGLHHAREWVAGASAMYIAETLVSGYGIDPDITALLDAELVLVVPVVNPDGYRYTWTTDRLWRKNRRDNGDGTFGVDLNRNYNDHFAGVGSSPLTTSSNFHGDHAFSEPETEALRDHLWHHPQLDRVVDLHCTGQFVLYPWAWTPDPSPDADSYIAVADDIVAAMAGPWGSDYSPGQWNTRLYPASGTAIDWASGRHGARAFLFELRDKGQYGFMLPAELLLPTAEEAWEGVWQVLQQPPERLRLRVEPVVLGERTRFVVRRATPGETVELYLSSTGEGTTVLLDGTELELDAAVRIGVDTAGPLGGAELSLWIDPGATGRTMWLQARQVGGLRSHALEADVP